MPSQSIRPYFEKMYCPYCTYSTMEVQRAFSIYAFQVVLSKGGFPCHTECDFERGIAYVANYTGGSFAAFKLDENGRILPEPILHEIYGQGSNVDKDRQEMAHAHGIALCGRYVYLADLGSDKIWHYVVSSGDKELEIAKAKPGFTACPKGYGPRHMTFNGPFAYVVYELVSQVGVFKIDHKNGSLDFVENVRIMPEDTIGEILLHL